MSSNDNHGSDSSCAVPEFLPNLNTVVDLACPETMSREELLELFKRRGFQSLVSKSDPIDYIVNLYYDHIMPMPSRSVSDTGSKSSIRQNPTPSNHSSNSNKLTKVSDSLDNIVITSDPKRLTPGMGTTPNCKDERTLTVKLPQQMIRKRLKSPELTVVDGSPADSKSNHQSSNGCQPTLAGDVKDNAVIPKKRVKLNRDFKPLV